MPAMLLRATLVFFWFCLGTASPEFICFGLASLFPPAHCFRRSREASKVFMLE
jgi:hypothetical protein